jgi:nitroreductase
MSKNIISKLAKERKTIRKFDSTPVKMADVITALEAGNQAPSGANSQPWRFLIITDPKIKIMIREASEEGEKEFYGNVKGDLKNWLNKKGLNWHKPFLTEAPLLVLVFSEIHAPYSIESVWISIGYILLALEENGLYTITYTPSNPEKILKKLEIPHGFKLEVVLPIGFSKFKEPKKERNRISEVSYLNSWGWKIEENPKHHKA